jgi:hypothetical protein
MTENTIGRNDTFQDDIKGIRKRDYPPNKRRGKIKDKEQTQSIELVGDAFGIECFNLIKEIRSQLVNLPEYKRTYEEVDGVNHRDLTSCTRIRRAVMKNGYRYFIGYQTAITPSEDGEVTTLSLWGGPDFDISNLQVSYRRKRNILPLIMTRDGLILDDSLEDAQNVQVYDDRVSFDLGPTFENKITVIDGNATYEYPKVAGLAKKQDTEGEEALVEIKKMYKDLIIPSKRRK